MMSIHDNVVALVTAMAPGPVQPGLHSTFVELGYSSLRLLELSIAVERAFALAPLTPDTLAGVRTVGDLVALVENLKVPS
jgi:acyl carrier protein